MAEGTGLFLTPFRADVAIVVHRMTLKNEVRFALGLYHDATCDILQVHGNETKGVVLPIRQPSD